MIRHTRFDFSLAVLFLGSSLLSASVFAASQTSVSATVATPVASTKQATVAAKAAQAPVPVGLVMWVKGAVTATQPKKNARTLQRRSPVYEHDVIATTATGSGQLVFTDSSTVSLRENTQFSIDRFVYKKEAPKQDQSVMSVIKGGFRTITGAVPKANPEGYSINTPVATIGVRGTEFSVVISPEDETLIKIDAGTIAVKNLSGVIEMSNCASCVKYTAVESSETAPVPLSVAPKEFAPSAEPALNPVNQTEVDSISTLPTPPGVSDSGSGTSGSTGSSDTTTTTDTSGSSDGSSGSDSSGDSGSSSTDSSSSSSDGSATTETQDGVDVQGSDTGNTGSTTDGGTTQEMSAPPKSVSGFCVGLLHRFFQHTFLDKVIC